MLLASKYEEMYAPEIGDFVYITDNAYSNAKIRSMEQKILRACDYDFSNPLCIHFLRRISKAGSVSRSQFILGQERTGNCWTETGNFLITDCACWRRFFASTFPNCQYKSANY